MAHETVRDFVEDVNLEVANIKRDEVWGCIMNIGRKKEGSGVNNFDDDDLNTILATMEFFGATDGLMAQSYFDLSAMAKPIAPRFKLWDWLAMTVMGRGDADDFETYQNDTALRVICHAYFKVGGDPVKFIDDLRVTDYQIDETWRRIEAVEQK